MPYYIFLSLYIAGSILSGVFILIVLTLFYWNEWNLEIDWTLIFYHKILNEMSWRLLSTSLEIKQPLLKLIKLRVLKVHKSILIEVAMSDYCARYNKI